MTLGYPRNDVVWELKGQRSRLLRLGLMTITPVLMYMSDLTDNSNTSKVDNLTSF